LKIKTKDKIIFRAQQVLLFVLHILLLIWIYYLLGNSGSMKMKAVLLHFSGIAIYGALLIRVCAYWGRYLFNKENRLKKEL